MVENVNQQGFNSVVLFELSVADWAYRIQLFEILFVL